MTWIASLTELTEGSYFAKTAIYGQEGTANMSKAFNPTPLVKPLNFAEVLQELELEPVKADIISWERWAGRLKLPDSLIEALRLGAGKLLTEHSNDERFLEPTGQLFKFRNKPVLPLLKENQGNYAYGLHLTNEVDPPMLLLSRWTNQNGQFGENRWRPFADNFASFAFARLFDYQYCWRPYQEGWSAELPFELPAFDPQLESRLLTVFKEGVSTPDVLMYPPGGLCRRFYRPGQRLSYTWLNKKEKPFWNWSSATPADHVALVTTLQEILG